MVIGGGDQEEFLKGIVEEEGIEGVEFHGPVPHHEVAEWFDRADVFVNSSREDNMPHSVIEAFSSGLPVVTTRAGGIPYIVEHERNGLLVDPDEPGQLADGVLRVLSDPAVAARLVEEGQSDCSDRYSWEAAGRNWAALYRRLARLEPAASPARMEMEV
jgi:glycosyltransferase involved in cell wall biosynthesis